MQAGQPVFSLAQDGERDAVFDVYEAIFFGDFDGGPISLTLLADPSVKATGYVREVSPAISAKSATIRVKVTIQNPGSYDAWELRCGTAKWKPVAQIALPWTALMAAGSRPAVWVVDPSTTTASLKLVTISRYEAGSVIVADGLEPGERVSSMAASCSVPVSSCLTRTVRHEEPALDHRCAVGFLAPDRGMQAGHPCIGACSASALDHCRTTPSGDPVFVGAVEPRFKTDLAFRVLGRLIARHVNLGDTVTEGQTVADIDPLPLELAFGQQEQSSRTRRLGSRRRVPRSSESAC